MALQKGMKQGRNVYMMFSRFITCSMVSMQYQGECGHIKGHACLLRFIVLKPFISDINRISGDAWDCCYKFRFQTWPLGFSWR